MQTCKLRVQVRIGLILHWIIYSLSLQNPIKCPLKPNFSELNEVLLNHDIKGGNHYTSQGWFIDLKVIIILLLCMYVWIGLDGYFLKIIFLGILGLHFHRRDEDMKGEKEREWHAAKGRRSESNLQPPRRGVNLYICAPALPTERTQPQFATLNWLFAKPFRNCPINIAIVTRHNQTVMAWICQCAWHFCERNTWYLNC